MTSRPTDNTAFFRALFESLNVGVLVANDDAVYVEANRAACNLFGRTREELVGLHLSQVVDDVRRDEVDLQWRAFIRDGSQNGVFMIRLPDGSPRELRFHARANVAPGLHASFHTLASGAGEAEVGTWMPTLCAWTKQVKLEDEWVPIEEYLYRAHGITVSHGMSPDAFEALDGNPGSSGN
jgi:PAS domain S-box-containing protein